MPAGREARRHRISRQEGVSQLAARVTWIAQAIRVLDRDIAAMQTHAANAMRLWNR